MAQKETLQAEQREVTGTTAVRRLRREGIVPGVVYGSSQREYPIQLKAKTFSDLLRHQTSENFLVSLEIEGAKEKTKLAIVQDIQRDPLTGGLVHVDFRAVSEDEQIHATVPITLTGEPAGVKAGGLLEQLIHSLEIHCRPGDLPERITNSVDALDVGQSLKVAELNMPEGVSTKMDGEVLVALIGKSRATTAAAAKGGGEGGDSGESGAGA